jgi:hypothetical protein
MKYLVISVKMKLSLEGTDPEKHDTALLFAYVALIILNFICPLVESTFMTLGEEP